MHPRAYSYCPPPSAPLLFSNLTSPFPPQGLCTCGSLAWKTLRVFTWHLSWLILGFLTTYLFLPPSPEYKDLQPAVPWKSACLSLPAFSPLGSRYGGHSMTSCRSSTTAVPSRQETLYKHFLRNSPNPMRWRRTNTVWSVHTVEYYPDMKGAKHRHAVMRTNLKNDAEREKPDTEGSTSRDSIYTKRPEQANYTRGF